LYVCRSFLSGIGLCRREEKSGNSDEAVEV